MCGQALPDRPCSSVRNIRVQVSRAWCVCASGPLSQDFGGLYCPPGGVPVKTRGGPGRPRLTAQHVWSAGDQGAIAGSELFRFRSQHTPSSIPQAVGLLFPGRRGCVFRRDQARRGRAGDNRRYFGQHCSAW